MDTQITVKKSKPIHPRNDGKPTKSRTIIVQTPIVPPTFSGKYSENPNEFLIRIQEYAEAVDGWDQTTLLLGISQFLRDAALDWHRHLSASQRHPRIWSDFVSLFLSRFDAPLKIARQAREWHQCEQMDGETIDDFFVRLRLLWTEQKPEESESDFIQHLLCKIRSDLFEMMTVRPGCLHRRCSIRSSKSRRSSIWPQRTTTQRRELETIFMREERRLPYT